jgi:hypothetical protein
MEAELVNWSNIPRTGPVTIRIAGHRILELRDTEGGIQRCAPGREITVDGGELETLEPGDFCIVESLVMQ